VGGAFPNGNPPALDTELCLAFGRPNEHSNGPFPSPPKEEGELLAFTPTEPAAVTDSELTASLFKGPATDVFV